jgi:hypothetical protein
VRRYKVHAYTDGLMEESDAEVRRGVGCAALQHVTRLLLQVTIYGVGKAAVQFHVEHDGRVADGWWHVTNLRVSDTGKIKFEDPDDEPQHP